MQMQPGRATILAQGQRGSTTPTVARIVAAGDAGREPVPETVDAPPRRMTRRAGNGGSFARSCRSRGISPGRPWAATPDRAECGRFPLPSCPPVLIKELVSSIAMGYKLPFSGGFLFSAAGPVGVQNVTFAGVFVPQEWNQHADQSASIPCPVGVWRRLHLGVPASFHRFDTPCKLLYTSRTSPKNPNSACPERRAAHCAPHPSLPCRPSGGDTR